MATVIDTLITEYEGRDKNSAVVEKMARNLDRLHGTIMRVAGAFAALEITSRAIEFGDKAKKAALEYEGLEARLTALTRSADAAGRKLQFVAQVAGPSPFSTKQLADAAVTLEAFGMNAERSLPLIGKLGAAFGATDEQIKTFTSAFGELGQGNFIDKDVLSSMGLSQKDFKAQGVKFDGQGALKSSAVETLAALERIVNEKYGNIFEEMAETSTAKVASLGDAQEKALRVIGRGLLTASAPFLENATRILTALTDSGVLDEVTQKIAGAFTGAFGGDNTDMVARFAAKTLAFFDILPERITAVANWFRSLGKTIADSLVTAYNWAGKGATGLYNTIGGGIVRTLALIETVSTAIYNTVTTKASEAMNWFRKTAADTYNSVAKFFNENSLPGRMGLMKWPTMDDKPSAEPKPMGDTSGAVNAAIDAAIAVATQSSRFKWTNATFEKITSLGDLFPKNLMPEMPDAGPREQEFYQRLSEALNTKPGGIPDTSHIPFLRNGDGDKADVMDTIEQNTRRTADHTKKQLDVAWFLFGGGNTAKSGVALADIMDRGAAFDMNAMGRREASFMRGTDSEYMASASNRDQGQYARSDSRRESYRPSGPPRIEVKAGRAASAIEQAIYEIATEVASQLVRSGMQMPQGAN